MAKALALNNKSRYMDVYDEPIDTLLTPIRGYQDKPLVTLEEAIEPVSGFFNEIEDFIQVALHNCQNPADGLDQQESASIHLYTMEFDDGPSLYSLLNQSLRAAIRDNLKSWFLYLKLFLTALYKLPSQNKRIWRGIKGVDLSSQYKTGTKFAWWGVSSCTADMKLLESEKFLGKTGQRTLFSIECINGKSIGKHSYFKQIEQEIILMPGSYFEVIGQLSPAPDLYIVELKEISPPMTLVKPPFSKSNEQKVSSVVCQPSASSSSTSAKTETTKAVDNIPKKKTSIVSVPLRAPAIGIHPNARWQQNGLTVAGGNGQGNRNNQLSNPCGLYIDDDQTIYIADTWNHRIIEWKWNATSGQVVAGGNKEGNEAHQLSYPRDVIVDKERDNLIICDNGNRRVVRWPRRNGTSGETIISNIDCWGLTMDENGSLYVIDEGKHEVRRYRRGESQGTVVAGGNGNGNRLDQLSNPLYVFVDRDHSVYVSDSGNNRVMKWMEGAKEGIVVAGGQGNGNSLRQLSYPRGVVVDQLDTVYVADCGNDRIMRWMKGATQGNIIVGGNGEGKQSNQLNGPVGLSFDRHGNLYVVDFGNDRVQKFNIDRNA